MYLLYGYSLMIDVDAFRELCADQPKHKALAKAIEMAIRSRKLGNGEKLAPQRQLAFHLNVTHGTVTRAYNLLANRGLVHTRLGAGTFVTYSDYSESSCAENLPEIFDFASSMQPVIGQDALIGQALSLMSQDGFSLAQLLKYDAQGGQKHKQVMAAWLSSRGFAVSEKDVMLTHGAQQSIFTALQILTNPGDCVLHEAVIYPGFFRACETCHAKPVAVPLVAGGIDCAAIKQLCEQHKPKAIYITPTLQNPTNLRYSSQTLATLLELAREYDFYIIEDDVNYCLPEDWHLPMQQQAADRVIYVSSLSKYFAGGLRLGYALVPQQLRQDFVASLHGQCWMVSGMAMELVSQFLLTEGFRHNQDLLAEELRYRQSVFKGLADKYGLNIRTGGLNVWLQLSDHAQMQQLQAVLLQHNVKVRTADLFANSLADVSGLNGMRVSLGGLNTRSAFLAGIAAFDAALAHFKRELDVVI